MCICILFLSNNWVALWFTALSKYFKFEMPDFFPFCDVFYVSISNGEYFLPFRKLCEENFGKLLGNLNTCIENLTAISTSLVPEIVYGNSACALFFSEIYDSNLYTYWLDSRIFESTCLNKKYSAVPLNLIDGNILPVCWLRNLFVSIYRNCSLSPQKNSCIFMALIAETK
jgi:hypothetical protein